MSVIVRWEVSPVYGTRETCRIMHKQWIILFDHSHHSLCASAPQTLHHKYWKIPATISSYLLYNTPRANQHIIKHLHFILCSSNIIRCNQRENSFQKFKLVMAKFLGSWKVWSSSVQEISSSRVRHNNIFCYSLKL